MLGIVLAIAAQAQRTPVTTMGTDFWVGFMPNARQSNQPQTLSLLVTGPTAATGTVSCGADSFTFTILPDSMIRVTIPVLNNHYNTTANGVHVTTTQPVSLYASNHKNYSHDITGVLPTPVLGTDYVLQSYPFHGSGVDNVFCIIATQNNTTVYYQLGATGTAVQTVTLQAGQAFQWQDNLDLSGTHVWTTDCSKPLAVFTGHEITFVPQAQSSGDHIFEQSIPTDYWGRRFVVTSSMGRVHDLLRVTALHDSTTFAFGDSTYSLQARETAEIDIRSDSMPAAYLESDKPVSVFLYLTGWSYGSPAGVIGDPSMLVIHPIEQQMRQVAFSTFVSTYSTYHYANITAERSAAGSIALDGTLIPDTAFHPVPEHQEYAYARIALSAGSHTLASSAGGFNAHLYGIGEAESYSYALGATLDPANPLAWANDIPSFLLDSTNNRFCPGDTLHFRAMSVNEDSTRIVWITGNGQTIAGAAADVVYTVPGDYSVAVIFSTPTSCQGTLQDTLVLPIHIQQPRHVVSDTTVCGDSCLWRGQAYTVAGSYSQYDVSDTADCLVRTLNLLNIYPPPVPAIEERRDCDSHRVMLAALGTGDRYTWTSTPADPALTGHEHDTAISTSPQGERTYTLLAAYSHDSLCTGTATYTKSDILGKAAWLNGIAADLLDSSNNRFCIGDTLHFTATTPHGDLAQIFWRFGFGPVLPHAETDTAFGTPGNYVATACFSYSDSCLGTFSDSIALPFSILARQQQTTDTAVCSDSCLWHGSIYRTSGTFTQCDEADTAFCPRLLMLNLNLNTVPTAVIRDSFACDSRQMHLKAEGTGACRWSCTPPDPALAGHEQDARISTDAAGERLYTLYVYNTYDTLCGSTATYVKPHIPPLAAHAGADPAAADGEHTQITLTDLSAGAIRRCWYVEGSEWSHDSVAILNFLLHHDSMTVMLEAVDSYGCRDTDAVVIHNSGAEVWLPNVFTPGAEINNRFGPVGTRITGCEIWIYDRRGDIVFHSDNAVSHPWDGTHDGRPCPQGTYAYRCRYQTPSLGFQSVAGTVTLLR